MERSWSRDRRSESNQSFPRNNNKGYLTKNEILERQIIWINKNQVNNPVVKELRINVQEADSISVDYVLGDSIGALYLSVKYHVYRPEYIKKRMDDVRKENRYRLRVLLLLIDDEDSASHLNDLSLLCFEKHFTLICGWTEKELASYIENFKYYEKRPQKAFRQRDASVLSHVVETLTSIPTINKTDANMLLANFGSLKSIINAPSHLLNDLTGFGSIKVHRMQRYFKTDVNNGEDTPAMLINNDEDNDDDGDKVEASGGGKGSDRKSFGKGQTKRAGKMGKNPDAEEPATKKLKLTTDDLISSDEGQFWDFKFKGRIFGEQLFLY